MASLSKNVASQNITFALITTAGAAATGKTVSPFVTKDNGSQASGGGTVTEAGNGQYNYAPTQAETNATDVGFLFTATGCVPENLDFHTDQVDGNSLLKVDVVDIAGSAVSASSAQLGVNVVNIAGVALAATALAQSTQSICWGTCSGGTTTTAVVSTLNNPSSLTASGQLIGRTIIFLGNSTTGGVQAQASNITASTTGSTPTITFTAMTTAPANGDVFVIL